MIICRLSAAKIYVRHCLTQRRFNVVKLMQLHNQYYFQSVSLRSYLLIRCCVLAEPHGTVLTLLNIREAAIVVNFYIVAESVRTDNSTILPFKKLDLCLDNFNILMP